MGGTAIMPAVVAYLSSRPNEPVTLAQLAASTGMEPPRVQKAISNAISGGAYGPALECVHRGQVWVWRGEANSSAVAPPSLSAPVQAAPVAPAPPSEPAMPEGLRKGDMVEIIGNAQSGDAVARDENGRLYRVVPL